MIYLIDPYSTRWNEFEQVGFLFGGVYLRLTALTFNPKGEVLARVSLISAGEFIGGGLHVIK